MLSLVHSNEYHGGQITVILSSFGGDFYWIDQIDQSFKDRLHHPVPEGALQDMHVS